MTSNTGTASCHPATLAYRRSEGTIRHAPGPGRMIVDMQESPEGGGETGRGELSTGVRSLRRGLDVLQAIADAGGEVSLRELSKRLQLAESTVHGLLQTLVNSGHVLRTTERRYALGHALIRLGEATNRKLGTQATPTLQEIATLTGENADLAVLEGPDAVYIAQAVMPGSTRSAREVERRLPAWATAAGRALLSRLTRSELLVFMDRHLPPTESLDHLLNEMVHVQRRGFAAEIEEVEAGISCLALPVDASPIPLVLAVTGPSDRMTAQRIPELVPHLRRLADKLGSDLRHSLGS